MSDSRNPFQSAPTSDNPYAAPPAASYNPYAAPQSYDTYAPEPAADLGFHLLATPGTRLLGAILDGLIVAAFAVPALLVFGFEQEEGIVAFIVAALAVSIVQWYLIATTGQSIAKKMLGMKIIKVDGSEVNFVSGVLLRIWVLQLAGAIPFVGNFVGLVDALMIFGNEHRCLHDHIAGTKVIRV